MSKRILILLCALLVSNTSYAEMHEYTINSAYDPNAAAFRTPEEYHSDKDKAQQDMDSIYYSLEDSELDYSEIRDNDMPLFKKTRLYLARKSDNVRNEDYPQKVFNKLKFWQKSKSKDEELIQKENVVGESIKQVTDIKANDDSLTLESGINEVVSEKEVQLDADNISYDENTNDIIATGHTQLYFPQQDTKIIADKIVYNQDSNVLKGIGNVYIIKSGIPTKSDYVELDMNEETVVSDKLSLITTKMIMDAEKAVQTEGMIILTNGNFHSDISSIERLSSKMVGPRFCDMIVDTDAESLFFGNPEGRKLKLDIDTITVDARKNHDVIKAKKIKISREGKHSFKWPGLTVYTNKERNYFEGSYPELGSRRKVGVFIGPGFAFGGPFGSVVKVIPFLNYKSSDFGVGGALKYRNTHNYTELGYGTANDIFFLRGRQRLDDNLFLVYGANSYSEEWFMGGRMPRYKAEVVYDKRYKKNDFLAENLPLTFRHRASFGLMKDNDQNFYGEHIAGDETTTTRLRYMAEVAQKLYSYQRPEDRFFFDVSAIMQGSAALYGTGDTQFVARIGPRIKLQYKNWMQELTYYLSGYEDETPMPRYDMYRYGHSAIRLSEVFRVNRYLSVGWSGNVNLSDDAPNGKLFQENRFAIAVGPDDLKVRLGYDFVRKSTYFGIDVAFDTKGTNINYNKMIIKNPERLGQTESEESSLAFNPTKPHDAADTKVNAKKSKSASAPKELRYAEVIDIEDPDKESIE